MFLRRRLSNGSLKSSGSAPSKNRALSLPDVNCKLDLDGNRLVLGRDGVWIAQNFQGPRDDEEMDRMRAHVVAVEKQNKMLRDRYRAVRSENRMLEFKNELLMELFAVSQLDSERTHDQYQKEALKTEALKLELGRRIMAMEKAAAIMD